MEDGNTGNLTWSTKPNWLGVAVVAFPLVVLIAVHL
jgi:hypothetical protein